MNKDLPPAGRFLGVLAALLVGLAAQYGLTLNQPEVVALMLSVYGGVHSIYRHYRGKTK